MVFLDLVLLINHLLSSRSVSLGSALILLILGLLPFFLVQEEEGLGQVNILVDVNMLLLTLRQCVSNFLGAWHLAFLILCI